jgi:hypothetical protein
VQLGPQAHDRTGDLAYVRPVIDSTRPHRRPWSGADRGSGTLEYVGVITLVAAVFAALAVVPLAPGLAQSLREAVCQVTHQSSCGYDRPVVRCTTSTRDRTVGASVTAFFVKAGHDDKYTITTYGDGTAEVALADTYSLGASGTAGVKLDFAAIAKELKAKGYGEASIAGQAGYQTVLKFDSRKDAEAWVDRNRGVLEHVVGAVGGVASDALEQGVNWIKRTTGIGDGDDARAPDAVVIDLGVQATGGGGYGASTLAGLSGEAKGTVKSSLRINADGTQTFTGSFDAEGTGTGSLAFVSGKLGLTGKAAYTVSFDKDGNPTQLTVVGEYGGSGGLGTLKSGVPIGGGKVKYGGDGSKGSKVTHSYTLNLKNPANRAAFDQAFVRAGPVVLPRPTSHFVPTGGVPVPDPVELAQQISPLIDRMGQDAVYVRAEYDTDQMGGTVGGSGEGFGIDGTYKGGSTALTAVQSQDYGVPSSVLAPMAGCTR